MQENNNQQFYEDWYDRISDSPTKSGNAKWEYYLLRCILKYIDKNLRTINQDKTIGIIIIFVQLVQKTIRKYKVTGRK